MQGPGRGRGRTFGWGGGREGGGFGRGDGAGFSGRGMNGGQMFGGGRGGPGPMQGGNPFMGDMGGDFGMDPSMMDRPMDGMMGGPGGGGMMDPLGLMEGAMGMPGGMRPGMGPGMNMGMPGMMGMGHMGMAGQGGPMGPPPGGMQRQGMQGMQGPGGMPMDMPPIGPPDLLGMPPLGPMDFPGGPGGPRQMMGGGMPGLAMGFNNNFPGMSGGMMGGMMGGGGPPMASQGRGAGGAAGGGSSEQPASISNDYSQNFVDSGKRPQNYLRDHFLTDRYEEYPKLKQLIEKKDEQQRLHATPPYFLKADLRSTKLSTQTFGTKFDVILVDPPWEEYVRRAPGMVKDPEHWPWQEIQALEVEAVADTPCFLFLWCGSEEGLEAGRVCMQKWGFRRCEDICWIKTNSQAGRKYLSAMNQLPDSVLTHTKEHCLMGIKGTVRRNTDGHIIHTNCDTDIIVAPEPELGSTQKPEEMYNIIERFCNGRRRLELFGEDHNIRAGWVTVGRSLTSTNFNPQVYANHFRNPQDGTVWVQNMYGSKPPAGSVILVPSTPEIEALRPRSPPNNGGGGGGHFSGRNNG